MLVAVHTQRRRAAELRERLSERRHVALSGTAPIPFPQFVLRETDETITSQVHNGNKPSGLIASSLIIYVFLYQFMYYLYIYMTQSTVHVLYKNVQIKYVQI